MKKITMEILASSPYLSYSLVIIVGLLFGSFNTMAVYRLPREIDIIWKRSHCPACKHTLSLWDLIPLFSWLLQNRCCRYCRQPIPARYLAVEIITAALFALIYAVVGWQWEQLIPLWILVVCLVIMVVIDFEYKIIPDLIHLVLIPTALWYRHASFNEFGDALVGCVAGVLVALMLRYGFWLWKKKEGLGLGDVKFFGVVGAFIQPELFAIFMFISGITGIVTGLIWQMLGKGEAFPFGPSLGFALFICVVFPEYVDVLGLYN